MDSPIMVIKGKSYDITSTTQSGMKDLYEVMHDPTVSKDIKDHIVAVREELNGGRVSDEDMELSKQKAVAERLNQAQAIEDEARGYPRG